MRFFSLAYSLQSPAKHAKPPRGEEEGESSHRGHRDHRGGRGTGSFSHRLHRFTQMGAAASWVESPEWAAALSTGPLRERPSNRFTNR